MIVMLPPIARTTVTANPVAASPASAAHDFRDAAIDAQARIHHAYFLGLQLMVATRKGPQAIGEWIFRLFRRQHHEKFLASFAKLGLEGLPHAVACARYHVLSNAIGGVDVQYIEESDTKAWVRFRYPRWMFAGPTICGVPQEASRGFLEGWYAHNGVSLDNPRLRFVCVSEDMTGEFGFCGYFEECDRELDATERLRFAKGELPPPFDPARQPAPPAAHWNAQRLAKAARNYAVEYVRNGICELARTIGEADTRELAALAARLTGMQCYRETAALVGACDGGVREAADYLRRMFGGLDDDVVIAPDASVAQARLRQCGLRVARGLDAQERALLLACWQELWVGAVRAHQAMLDAEASPPRDPKGGDTADALDWTIRAR